MKERPILMNAAMVRATLNDVKTQTRRIIKPQPDFESAKKVLGGDTSNVQIVYSYSGFGGGIGLKLPDVPGSNFKNAIGFVQPNIKCPYGNVGDRLWVRESFWGCDLPGYGDQPCIVYDNEWDGKEYSPVIARPWGRKFGRIPSIHMPRDASRIDLEITDVRVERLNDIGEEDAKAEGAPGYEEGIDPPPDDENQVWSYRASFRRLWESINGTGSWEANPWVWAINFKRLD